MMEPKTTCVAPWFGSNRMLAAMVGEEFAGCKWVGVPFAGGMSELLHIQAPSLLVNDLHRHVINLARVMANPNLGAKLYRQLRRVPFHVDSLKEAQQECLAFERLGVVLSENAQLRWATAYFCAAWMPRHGSSGTEKEFNVGLSLRYNGNGGDSAKHYWSAVESIVAWRKVLQRANFTVMDYREFLLKCKDEPKSGIYCDPPFPGPGEKYAHKLSEFDHKSLAAALATFKQSRVVCRFYDHPLIRELYPETQWTWRHLKGRKQTNDEAPEVLLINGPSYA